MMNMKKANTLLSDMAPEFCGELDLDFFKMTELNSVSLMAADKLLRPGGNLIMKTLQGSDERINFVFS